MRFQPRNPDFDTAVQESFARQGAISAIGAELLDVEPGLCRIRLRRCEAATQQHGFFHGGIIAMIADVAGGYAAMALCPPATEVLTVEFKVNFVAPAQGAAIVATGRVVRAGRTLIVTRIDVDALDESGQATECAILQQTIMAVMPPAGGRQ